MTIDLEKLPPAVQFVYIAMTKSAIFLKEIRNEKKFFLAFCEEIWDSMEMSEPDHLNEVLNDKMKKDIEPYVQSYISKNYQADLQKNSEK